MDFKELIEQEDFEFESGYTYSKEEMEAFYESENFETVTVIFIDDNYPGSPIEIGCIVKKDAYEVAEGSHLGVLTDSCGIVSGDTGYVISFYYDEDGEAIASEF